MFSTIFKLITHISIILNTILFKHRGEGLGFPILQVFGAMNHEDYEKAFIKDFMAVFD